MLFPTMLRRKNGFLYHRKAIPKACRELQDGRLPYNHIPRVWGGPSALEMCDGCESPITEHQMVMEGIALAGGRSPLQMHVRCFGILG